tara:strand:- start:574 stop:720 length:147 start_codon:yes stop_codon:yes gene_type:complete
MTCEKFLPGKQMRLLDERLTAKKYHFNGSILPVQAMVYQRIRKERVGG